MLSKCETEVKQAGSHLMYLCCWLTLGPAITLLLYFVNIRVHLYKGMILQLPPCDIWQVTKLKFLDMYFNQDCIKPAPCAWAFSVHMSRGLGKCCCAVILIITGVVKVKGTGKEVWSVCECCAASLATPTSCCAQPVTIDDTHKETHKCLHLYWQQLRHKQSMHKSAVVT